MVVFDDVQWVGQKSKRKSADGPLSTNKLPVFHDFWWHTVSINFFLLPFIQISTLIWNAKVVFLFRLSRVCSLEAFLICWTENWTWGVRIHLGEGQESLRGKFLTARLNECLTLPQCVQFAIYISYSLKSILFHLRSLISLHINCKKY